MTALVMTIERYLLLKETALGLELVLILHRKRRSDSIWSSFTQQDQIHPSGIQ
jgi:hypothetical protein